jgi:ribosomal protein L22
VCCVFACGGLVLCQRSKKVEATHHNLEISIRRGKEVASKIQDSNMQKQL